MSSKRLRHLQIPDGVADTLAAKDIKECKDVLLHSPIELLRLGNCSYPQIQDLILTCSEAVAPSCVNGLTLRNVTESLPHGGFLPTSLPGLDRILHGGFPVGNISEITGPAGSGKTQFCMMLSALAAVSDSKDDNGGVLYIDTEGAFSAQRLLQMVESTYPDLESGQIEEIVSRVYLVPVQSCAALMTRVDNLEEDIITKNIRLIVLDSVASLMRKEFSSASQSIIERTNVLTRLAAILKYTAEFFKLPVITTNQITTKFKAIDSKTTLSEEFARTSDLDLDNKSHLTAALGNTWGHSVNTRLILQFWSGDCRQVLVAKSPVAPFAAVTYTIQSRGLVQKDEQVVIYEGTDPGEQSIRSRGSIPCTSSQY